LQAPPFAVGVGDLHLVLFAAAQPRSFEHPLEHELSPGALGLARALEGFGELPRFTAQGLVERHELSHLLGERGAILSFGDVGLFDLALEFGQTQLERFEQGTQFVPGSAR